MDIIKNKHVDTQKCITSSAQDAFFFWNKLPSGMLKTKIFENQITNNCHLLALLYLSNSP